VSAERQARKRVSMHATAAVLALEKQVIELTDIVYNASNAAVPVASGEGKIAFSR
jgi:hypothetical protein